MFTRELVSTVVLKLKEFWRLQAVTCI